MIQTGREETMFNGKSTPIKNQVKFEKFNENGVKVTPLAGASPAAERYAMTASNGLTSYARLLACGNNKKCDFKAIAKDKAAVSQFKKAISGIVDG